MKLILYQARATVMGGQQVCYIRLEHELTTFDPSGGFAQKCHIFLAFFHNWVRLHSAPQSHGYYGRVTQPAHQLLFYIPPWHSLLTTECMFPKICVLKTCPLKGDHNWI